VDPRSHKYGAENWTNVMRSTRLLRWAVKDAVLIDEKFPIVIGGDRTTAIGAINGIKGGYLKSKVLWVSGNVDSSINTTSVSGNMRQMPIGILTGAELTKDKTRLSSKEIAFIGINDPKEHEL
jgi:arginase family enzyme